MHVMSPVQQASLEYGKAYIQQIEILRSDAVCLAGPGLVVRGGPEWVHLDSGAAHK